MLPNLLIIGAMKSGTTSLHRYLSTHPEIFMSRLKELDFFAEELNWTKGRGWYEAQFEEAGGARIRGESSTSYTKYPQYQGVPARAAALVPDAQLVYIVRDPIQRMKSHYFHELSKGRERDPFHSALLTNPKYIQVSMYANQIEQYLDHFSREQLLVITAEDLRDRREHTLRLVCNFLRVDETWSAPVTQRTFNTTQDRVAMRRVEVLARRLPGWSSVMQRLPLGLKRNVRRFTTRPIAAEAAAARIDPSLEAELRDRLRDDVARLRTFMDPAFDGWGIA